MLHEVNFLSYNNVTRCRDGYTFRLPGRKESYRLSTDSVSIPEGICI